MPSHFSIEVCRGQGERGMPEGGREGGKEEGMRYKMRKGGVAGLVAHEPRLDW
jgi:hypothetical protein